MDNGLVCVPANVFFLEAVREAFKERKVFSQPVIENYLSGLLQFFITADNFYQFTDENGRKRQRSLAEMFLESNQLENNIEKMNQLKILGDFSLYVSGFFGESLKKKVVDINYYVSVGRTVYSQLAQNSQSGHLSEVFEEFSTQLMTYVDILTCISRKSLFRPKKDILRVYETYLNTGSDLAKKDLVTMGLYNLGDEKKEDQ